MRDVCKGLESRWELSFRINWLPFNSAPSCDVDVKEHDVKLAAVRCNWYAPAAAIWIERFGKWKRAAETGRVTKHIRLLLFRSTKKYFLVLSCVHQIQRLLLVHAWFFDFNASVEHQPSKIWSSTAPWKYAIALTWSIKITCNMSQHERVSSERWDDDKNYSSNNGNFSDEWCDRPWCNHVTRSRTNFDSKLSFHLNRIYRDLINRWFVNSIRPSNEPFVCLIDRLIIDFTCALSSSDDQFNIFGWLESKAKNRRNEEKNNLRKCARRWTGKGKERNFEMPKHFAGIVESDLTLLRYLFKEI